MAARKPKKPATRPLAAVLLESQPANLTVEAARILLGGKVVKRLADVGEEFELAPMTIRSNWRRDGMPGTPGKFDLAEIVVWRIAHEAKFQGGGRQDVTPRAKRKEEAEDLELQKLRIEVAKRQREESFAEGHLIDRESALSAGRALISVATARVESSASEIEPLLPIKIAKAVIAENKRNVCRALKSLAEAYVSDIVKEFEGGDDA